MIEFSAITVLIVLALLFYVWLFTVVYRQVSALINLVCAKRDARKFFKKIERFRRDFDHPGPARW